MKKWIAAIDPGVSAGALVIITGENGNIIIKEVLVKNPSGGLDLKILSETIKEYNELWKPIWYLEKIHAIFGTGKGSMFTMAEGFGAIQGILTATECDWHFVTPKDWQKKVIAAEDIVLKDPGAKRKVRDTKATALNAAKRLFPEVDFRYGQNEETKGDRRTKPHSGLIDATLIAYSQLGN